MLAMCTCCGIRIFQSQILALTVLHVPRRPWPSLELNLIKFSAVERIWHESDGQGHILALA
jgi:hypothetical protein